MWWMRRQNRSTGVPTSEMAYLLTHAIMLNFVLTKHIEELALFPRKTGNELYDWSSQMWWMHHLKKCTGVFIINAHFNVARMRLPPAPLLQCWLRSVMLCGGSRFTKNAHFCNFYLYASPANIGLGGSGANHHIHAWCVRWAFIMKTPVHFFRWCIHHTSDDQS